MNPAERTALRLAVGALAWVLLFLGAMTFAACYQPADDTDPQECGELSSDAECDGQT